MTHQRQPSEQLQDCLICFDGKPDAVFMNCGHGGVCYECAIDVWKKSAECYLCRKEIVVVYQLDCKKGKYFEIIAETKRFEKEKKETSSSSSISSERSVDYDNFEAANKKGGEKKESGTGTFQQSLDNDPMFDKQ